MSIGKKSRRRTAKTGNQPQGCPDAAATDDQPPMSKGVHNAAKYLLLN